MGCGYSDPMHCPVGTAGAALINLVGVPQPKPKHGFSPHFQDMFTP